jgi:UDP-N-acetylmuramoyl-tripeptide--D-alanyl-D-alanine ligase
VLGDMLELGPAGPDLHEEVGARVGPKLELLIAVGPLAAHFLTGARSAGAAEAGLVAFPDAAAAAAGMAALVAPGDAVLVKGSRGVRLEAVVEALLARGEEQG